MNIHAIQYPPLPNTAWSPDSPECPVLPVPSNQAQKVYYVLEWCHGVGTKTVEATV